MPGTFASELTQEGLDLYGWVEIASWGRRQRLGCAAEGPYRWSTIHPYDHGWAALDARNFVDLLRDPDDVVEEQINLRSGATDLGGWSFSIVDGAVRLMAGDTDHGWGEEDVVTALLGVHASGNYWEIDSNVAAADVTISLASLAGLQQGMALWFAGGEVVWVDAVNPGPGSIDVTRACYNTRARDHLTRSAGGEGRLYDRPKFVRGLEVRFYVNLFDSRTGYALPEAQAKLVFRGSLEEWGMDGPNVFQFTCKSALGQLDRTLGREQFSGTAVVSSIGGMTEQQLLGRLANGDPVPVAITRAAGPGQPTGPGYPSVGGTQTYHARLGDNLVEVEYDGTDHILSAFDILGMPSEIKGEESYSFWDVLLCSSKPGGADLSYFTLAGGRVTSHPLEVALALITSTGAGTNGDYDVLPAKWGAGVPSTWINWQSFYDLIPLTATASVSNMVIGRDGKPFRLRRFLEEQILGPLGLFLYPDHEGLVTLGCIRELYPSDSWPEITEDDIQEDPGGLPLISIAGNLDQTISRMDWSYAHDLATDKPTRVIKYVSPLAAERDDDDSELKHEAPGISPTPDSEAMLTSIANSFIRWFAVPIPIVKVSVHLYLLQTDVTAGVLLTCTLLPNTYTGLRGMTQMPATVIARRVCFGQHRIELTLLLTGTPNTKLWAPAGRVTVYDAGPPVLVDLAANDFTRASGAPTGVPARDALAFEVNDFVMVVDSDRQPLSTAVQVAAVEPGGVANRLELTAAPVPAPVAGNFLVYCHYQGGAAPANAWTTHMLQHAAQADVTTGVMPNGDAATVYGGV